MKDQVRDGVLRSFRRLVEEDGNLFDCPIEEHSSYDARKLHEVCVNHRLANHLEEEIIPFLRIEETLFVDIEFNREGVDFKNVRINGEDKTVRPDIIIHNRKTGPEKLNCLVVECKKRGAPKKEIKEDREKIRALIEDERYEYSFGLQVVYGKDGVRGMLFDSPGYRPEALEVAREILRSRDIVDQSPEAYEAAHAASDVRDHEPRIMGRRFANFILDLVLFNIISTLIVFIVLGTGTERDALKLIYFPVVFLLYFAFEATLQRTPAKFLTGTIVIAADGSRPTPRAIAIRTISRFVPFEPLSGGRIGLNPGEWWHDRWSKTS